MQFQELFGIDIYNFPIKVRRREVEKAADFYCYCFEKNRIFKRLLTFKGLCSLRTYQYHLLNNLYNEWARAEREREIPFDSLESLEDGGRGSFAENKKNNKGILSIFSFPESEVTSSMRVEAVIEKLDEEERILIKLLSYQEFGLEMEDLRIISSRSNRPLVKVMDILNDLDKKICEKDEEYSNRRAKLDELEVRILRLERKSQKVAQRGGNQETSLAEELEGLTKKLAWRKKQKQELIERSEKVAVRLSYRDMAELLNISLGSLSAKLDALRKKFSSLYSKDAQ